MSIEGILFYWVAWIFWIIATFFMKRSEAYRLNISLCGLIAIILNPYHIEIFEFRVNASLFIFYFFAIMQIVKLSKGPILYTFICSYIIMMAYASFLLFELYDPVWVLFDRNWLLGVILCYLCVLLQQLKWNRAYILIVGMVQGDMIFSMVLQRIGIDYNIGSGAFQDVFATSLAALFIWSIAEMILVNMDQYVNTHIRGKQKST
ncbi:hypothetical protein HHO41_08365 [Bacillus sp. DNRA2]|uniref:YphA family membrane protein n=1 Tax=Bacillus sp. DNRA2 TaxID=2723053 RepID=UPI00145CB80D|nr:hypothetical protein [Bacillus sp. DNRA2]NMD70305.1 hypothetical protein [Bacillus sp. DNRA2]